MPPAFRLLYVALLFSCGAAPLPAQMLNPPAPGPATSPAPAALLAQGLAALEASQPRQALADFEQILASNPNHATANLFAATAALELFEGPLAVRYAEAARRLDPQNWKVDTTLVAAYAAADMKPQRDQERALLRQLHSTGVPEARQATGFLLEMFPVNLRSPAPAGAAAPAAAAAPYRVDAIEYFQPMGEFHTFYRFLVRRPDGRRIWEIDVQSNDFDEKSWAQVHPAQAAAGERQFQLTGHGDSGRQSASGKEVDYRMFSGHPDYDTIRAMVVQALAEHPPTP